MSDQRFIMLGIGGAGGKTVNAVAESLAGKVEAVAVDTDFAAVSKLGFCRQIRLGETRFGGIGAGGDAPSARMAATEETATLHKLFEDCATAVIVASLGGGTGAGVLPVVLAAADEMNIPTLVFAISPFTFEGDELLRRASKAELAIEHLGGVKIVCKNSELCHGAENLPFADAMRAATKTLALGITLFHRLVNQSGYISVDRADLLHILRKGRGRAYLGVGTAQGPHRLDNALSVLFDQTGTGIRTRLKDTKAALVGILGGDDLRLKEIGDTMTRFRGALDYDTEILMGTVLAPEFTDELRIVTLLLRNWELSVLPVASPVAEPDAGAYVPEAVTVTPAAAPARHVPGKRRNAKTVAPYDARFKDGPQTLRNGEDLDTPTYLRRGIHIPN